VWRCRTRALRAGADERGGASQASRSRSYEGSPKRPRPGDRGCPASCSTPCSASVGRWRTRVLLAATAEAGGAPEASLSPSYEGRHKPAKTHDRGCPASCSPPRSASVGRWRTRVLLAATAEAGGAPEASLSPSYEGRA